MLVFHCSVVIFGSSMVPTEVYVLCTPSSARLGLELVTPDHDSEFHAT